MLNHIKRTGLAGLGVAIAFATILTIGFMSSPARPQAVDVSACPVEGTVAFNVATLGKQGPVKVYDAGQSALLVEGIAQKVGRQPYQFDVTSILVFSDPEKPGAYEVGFAHQGCILDVKILPRHLWDSLVRETFGQNV